MSRSMWAARTWTGPVGAALICLVALAGSAAAAVAPDPAPVPSRPAPDPHPGASSPPEQRVQAAPAAPAPAPPAPPAPEPSLAQAPDPAPEAETTPAPAPRRSATPATRRPRPSPSPPARARPAATEAPDAAAAAARSIARASGTVAPAAPIAPAAEGAGDDGPLVPAAIAFAVLAAASLSLLVLARRVGGPARSRARPIQAVAAGAVLGAALLGALGDDRAEAAVPTVVPVCDGAVNGCDGWWNAPVTLSWRVTPADADRVGCTPRSLEADGVHQQTCTATHGAPAASASVTVTVRVDRTPPQGIAANVARPPDHSGWYTSPVAVTFTGADALSGVAACDAVTYAGPDSLTASVSGGCVDGAGNRSAALAVGLRYDATPPALDILTPVPGDGFSIVRWRASPDAAVHVVRTPGLRRSARSVVFRGRSPAFVDRRVENRRAYRYHVVAVDQAGNATSGTVAARPGRRLLAPARGAHVSGAPLLRWTAVARTRYYNVQLRRNGRKVMTAWPTRPMLRLRSGWRFAGVRRGLTPGFYRWDVWPGIGPREAGRFGRRIGTGTFVVDAGPASPGPAKS